MGNTKGDQCLRRRGDDELVSSLFSVPCPHNFHLEMADRELDTQH